eukprot:scaffold139_cov325-Pavlova_lutheri.AAC.50
MEIQIPILPSFHGPLHVHPSIRSAVFLRQDRTRFLPIDVYRPRALGIHLRTDPGAFLCVGLGSAGHQGVHTGSQGHEIGEGVSQQSLDHVHVSFLRLVTPPSILESRQPTAVHADTATTSASTPSFSADTPPNGGRTRGRSGLPVTPTLSRRTPQDSAQ